MSLRLRVVSADGRRFEHEVEGDSLVVGRSSRADLALADRAMSREHARLQHGADGWVIEDLGSHNGTRVNEAPIEGPHRLRDGDTVSLGGSVLVVEVKGEDEAPSGDSVIYRSAKELLQAASGSTDVSGIGSSGRKAADRLHMLNQVNQALASSISLEELLELILDRAFEHLKPQEAAIYLRDAAGNDVCAARRSTKGRESAADRTLCSGRCARPG
jgi:pSer/pThr/pTyr-binding forkhead associated (FHA) protein